MKKVLLALLTTLLLPYTAQGQGIVTDSTPYGLKIGETELTTGANEVAVYARLPRTFKIPTPVGHYAPDWAVAFHDNMGVKHIFFVAETKGSLLSMDLKGAELSKIECAKKLFNELSTSKVRYHEVTDYQNMLNEINSLM